MFDLLKHVSQLTQPLIRLIENDAEPVDIQVLREKLKTAENCNVIKLKIAGKIREALVRFTEELTTQGQVEVYGFEKFNKPPIYYSIRTAKEVLAELNNRAAINPDLNNTENQFFAVSLPDKE